MYLFRIPVVLLILSSMFPGLAGGKQGLSSDLITMKNGDIQLVVNTTSDKKAISESYSIRRTALTMDIPYTTTMAAAKATALAIKSMNAGKLSVKTIQEYHG